MKRKLLSGMLAVVLILLLAGCGCDHTWQAATCTAAKTCELCGEIQGQPKGHTYQDATCTEAKTCTVCKAAEGEPLGHTWQDATCTEAKICTVCKATEGEPRDHIWQEATTEAPQTCELCSLTEGEKLETDPRFTTASTRPLHGDWVTEYEANMAELGLAEDFTNGYNMVVRMNFSKTGEMTITMELEDEEEFRESYRAYTLAAIYESIEQAGLTKEQGDEEFLKEYGMDIEGYVEYMLNTVNMNTYLQAFNINGVYYVQDDLIYTGPSWNYKDMEGVEFTIRDGALTIEGLSFDGKNPAIWHRG